MEKRKKRRTPYIDIKKFFDILERMTTLTYELIDAIIKLIKARK
jgi:hypothetical protein